VDNFTHSSSDCNPCESILVFGVSLSMVDWDDIYFSIDRFLLRELFASLLSSGKHSRSLHYCAQQSSVVKPILGGGHGDVRKPVLRHFGQIGPPCLLMKQQSQPAWVRPESSAWWLCRAIRGCKRSWICWWDVRLGVARRGPCIPGGGLSSWLCARTHLTPCFPSRHSPLTPRTRSFLWLSTSCLL